MIHLLWEISLVMGGMCIAQGSRVIMQKLRFVIPQPTVHERPADLEMMIARLLQENKRLNIEVARLTAYGDYDEEHY